MRSQANMPYLLVLGMSLANLAKILKCAGKDDILTMKAQDEPDTVCFMFESPSK